MVVLCGFILIRLNIVKYCNCAKHGMAIGLTTECVEHVVWRLAECIFSASPSFSLTPWVHISHCFDPAGAPRGRTQSLAGAEPRVSRSSWELGIGRLWHPKIYVRNANLFAERVGEIQWTQRGKNTIMFFANVYGFNDTLLWLLKITIAIIASHTGVHGWFKTGPSTGAE
jgi:hypothetical protein